MPDLSTPDDGAMILTGLTQALRKAGAASYAEQVEAAALAVAAMIAREQPIDAVWAEIAAAEHAEEIAYSFRSSST